METVIQSVGALGLSERTALERLVGHPLLDDQRLVIRIDGANGSVCRESNSSESLPEWCNVFEGLSDERIDEIDRAIVRSSNSREVVFGCHAHAKPLIVTHHFCGSAAGS